MNNFESYVYEPIDLCACYEPMFEAPQELIEKDTLSDQLYTSESTSTTSCMVIPWRTMYALISFLISDFKVLPSLSDGFDVVSRKTLLRNDEVFHGCNFRSDLLS